jgi:PhnB protein
MRWNPYLNFNGQCEEAFKFYARCLGGTIEAMIPYGESESAEHVPADLRNKIMHARLVVGNQVLMGNDAHPGQPYEGVKGCSVAVQADAPDAAARLFHALAEHGRVTVPLQETSWAVRFGMFTDRFGVPWLISCEKAG